MENNNLEEGIEINKNLTKKDILAMFATLIGQLSAISANAKPDSSMYTMYAAKALKEVQKAEQIFKMEAPKLPKDVKFQINESMTEKEQKFADWLRTTKFDRQAQYHDFEEIWPTEDNGELLLCMAPMNPDGSYDERVLSWSTKTGKVEVHPAGSISKDKVKEGVSFMSKVWQNYKSKIKY